MQRNQRTLRSGPPPAAEPSASLPPRSAINRVTSIATKGQREPRQRPLRVLLVEDSQLLVQRISELVEDLPNVQLAGTAASEADAVASLEADGIDAIILDLQLHTGSGFGVLRALHRLPSRPTVIVFTNFAIGAYRDTAMSLGASHFLDKSRDYDQLPGILQALSDSAH
jgi:two-component system, OmpR family, response regulator